MSRQRRLLDEVRDLMRLHHYSIHTERSYCDWIKRYVHFHAMSTREDLHEGEAKIEAFLTHLAVPGNVAPSTQNQAMNALVFLYKRVLGQPLDQEINAVRASRKLKVPLLNNHLVRVKALHEQDRLQGYGEVYMPHALGRKYRGAAKEWGWQYVFPARNLSTDPRTGIVRRHHVDPSVRTSRWVKRRPTSCIEQPLAAGP